MIPKSSSLSFSESFYFIPLCGTSGVATAWTKLARPPSSFSRMWDLCQDLEILWLLDFLLLLKTRSRYYLPNKRDQWIVRTLLLFLRFFFLILNLSWSWAWAAASSPGVLPPSSSPWRCSSWSSSLSYSSSESSSSYEPWRFNFSRWPLSKNTYYCRVNLRIFYCVALIANEGYARTL